MTARQWAILLLLAALWGAAFLFMRVAAPVLGPVWLIEWRVLIAGVALLPLILRRHHLQAMLQHYKPLLLVGLLNAALPFTLFAYATTYLDAGVTSILNATVPIFGLVFAYLVLKEQLGLARIAGIVCGFFGVTVLIGGFRSGSDGLPLLPVLSCLLAAFCYVLAAHYTRLRLADMSPLVFVTGSQLAAALLLLPFLPFTVPQHSVGVAVMVSVAGLALLSTALAFVLYFRLLREVGLSQTLTVAYLIPLFGVLWGSWLLGERLDYLQVAGGGLILLGVALANGVRVAHRKAAGG